MAPPRKYPRYDLESCLEVARILHFKAGGEASSNELASYLGYKSTNNGAYLARVAASKMFGFVEGSATNLRCSRLAIDILQPDYPETAARARLEAFEAVPLFASFLKEYEGQPLPNETGMRNALINKFGVTSNKAPMALGRLLDSADQAGLFMVSGARTKLIRPTFRESPNTAAALEAEPSTPASQSPNVLSPPNGYPKIVEGALESVPWEGTMSDEEVDDWIDFFRAAMKMHFRLKR